MSGTKLRSITIPSYSKGEEVLNMVSHILGGALGITAIVLCVIMAAVNHNAYGVVGSVIFGVMMITLYSMSSVYHGLNSDQVAKKVFRILDHCAIYLLIAGTYTPIALCTVREYNPVLGWILFGSMWVLAVIGIIYTATHFVDKNNVIEVILFLGMGWSSIFVKDVLTERMEPLGLAFLFGGGIAYSLGVIFYALGSKRKYIHSVFHLFVLLGSLLHFFCILFFVI